MVRVRLIFVQTVTLMLMNFDGFPDNNLRYYRRGAGARSASDEEPLQGTVRQGTEGPRHCAHASAGISHFCSWTEGMSNY